MLFPSFELLPTLRCGVDEDFDSCGPNGGLNDRLKKIQMKCDAVAACWRRNSMDPAVYVKREELFTTKNSPAVYQDSDTGKSVRKFLRHRNGEFHVDRKVIGPCAIADALAFQLANAGGHKDMVNCYLRHAGACWPGWQVG